LLLTKFFDSIARFFPGDPFHGRGKELARLNPEKFYVENVRNALGISTRRAQRICDIAVRQGLFERRVEVLCPDDVVAASARAEAELPERVRCWDEREEVELEIETAKLRKVIFYRLLDERPKPDSAAA
jgi:hypothetical protein